MDTKERCDTYYDQSYQTKLQRGEAARQELWNAHFWSPTFALSEAVENVGTWEDADPSAGGAEADFHVSLFLRGE